MAQVEDPGYGSEDEYEDVSSSGPRLQAFENLGELELWISRTYYDDDSEWEDESEEMLTGPPTSKIEKADEDSVKHSIENFTNTMRDKHQRVKVTCRVFLDTRTLKTRWSEHY
ncbi:hypothetical protein GMOD_00002111 [Pyrenophora seminiperda CCB06]|uniref:Uncharacterized protein n=1 Tax=Pyrenophora seminiperda CCB06 TaxID=1302712 RepID=A0A3M7LWY2_9PLEO|nr:hypothetical protein GMOD_00002111 [Pyrenophora seminiperda CCB06]